MTENNKERRRFFRIEDIVGLRTEVIDPEMIDDRLNNFWKNQQEFSVSNEFNYKLEQNQAELQHIKSRMPEVGRYLEMLQEQLEIVTSKLLKDDDRFSDLETQVNLSAQGISFYSNGSVKKGDIIEMHLNLIPEQQQIVILAKVVNCEKVDHQQQKYKISLNFEYIHEADRELLVKHVHGKQLRSLGAARFEKDQ